MTDVAYFIGSSVDTDTMLAHQQELVRIYHGSLSEHAIGAYDWDKCWRDYRRFCFHGMQCGIVAPMLVERSERSDQLFLQMVRKCARQIEALGGLSFWE